MKNIWGTIVTFLKNDFVQKIILSAITALITYYFTSKKNRQDLRIKHQNVLGEKICQAYINVRELIEECNTVEFLNIEDISIENILVSVDRAVYPSFMNDKESLFSLLDNLEDVRKNSEPYLDLTAAAELYAMERYLISLSLFIRENKLEEKCRIIGCVVIVDLTRRLKQLDKYVVNKINKPKFKLYSKEGMVWKRKKQKAVNKYLIKSELNKLIIGQSDFPIDMLTLEHS